MSVGVLLLDDDEDLLEIMGELLRMISGRPTLALRTVAELKARQDEALQRNLAIPGVPALLPAATVTSRARRAYR